MITKYSDLASNERTYLSWIRTAIAVMAFGFLIEKFELFFSIIKQQTHFKSYSRIHMNLSKGVEIIGLSMMVVAVIIIFGATIRYIKQREHILNKNEEQAFSTIFGTLFAGLLIFVALLLIAYLLIRIIY